MPKLFEKPAFHLSAVDKVAFNSDAHVDIDLWARLYWDAEIFPWQSYFMRQPQHDKMVVAGIRVGKSKAAAFGLLHWMQFHPHSRVLNTSISSMQAKIVFQAMMELIGQSRYKHWVEHVEKSPYPLIQLVNGSEAWFRSVGYEAELIRGFEFDIINLDEAAYVTSPMTVTTLKGRLLGFNALTNQPRAARFWQMTSPHGKTGWVFERWKKGDPRYHEAEPEKFLSLRVRTTENPLLDADTLREIMADYTERMIRQELYGEFTDADGVEFPMEQIEQCYNDTRAEVRWLYEQITSWRERRERRPGMKEVIGISEDLDFYELEPQPGHQYVASWDIGKRPTKRGRNATVGMVFDVTQLPWKLVAFRYEEGKQYLQALEWIETWHMKYSSRGTDCETVIDASGKGDVLNEIIEDENNFRVDGIIYSSALKPNLIASGKIAVERGMVCFPFIRRFVDQLSVYEQNDRDLAQDIVMAFCQAMYKAREVTGVSTARPTIETRLYRRATLHPEMRRYAERRVLSRHQRTGRYT